MPGPHKAQPEIDKCVFLLVIGVGALPAMSSQALYSKPSSSFHEAAAELRSKRGCSKDSDKGLYCIYIGQKLLCMVALGSKPKHRSIFASKEGP